MDATRSAEPDLFVDEPLVRVRTHPNNSGRKIGSACVARDYSLRKLAARTRGRARALVAKERSRNALAHSAALAAHGDRWTRSRRSQGACASAGDIRAGGTAP